MNKTKIEAVCNSANTRFISESLSGYPKYKYLPQWLDNKSIYLTRERTNTNPNHRIYKRGTIVYIDFGVNVGYELSGNHFAIVLNNKDNSRNGVLCVVPISSKNKNNYVPVGKIIEIQSIKHFVSQSDKTKEHLRVFVLSAMKKGFLKSEPSDTVRKIIENGPPLSDEEIEKKANKLGFDLHSSESAEKIIDNFILEAEANKKVFDVYKRYTKDSFAMPLNIQTVSKNRIRQINKFDPAGKIKAPYDVLNKIDNAVAANFTKI